MPKSRHGARALGLGGALALVILGPAFGYAPEDGAPDGRPEVPMSLAADPKISGAGATGSGGSFRACAETAYEIFDYILKLGTGVAPEKARAFAPTPGSADALRSLIEAEGLESAYMTSHVFYLRCASEVEARLGAGEGPPSREEAAYAACSRRSASRLLALTAARDRPTEASDRPGPPRDAGQAAAALYKIAERDGLLKALVVSGEAHRDCVDVLRER